MLLVSYMAAGILVSRMCVQSKSPSEKLCLSSAGEHEIQHLIKTNIRKIFIFSFSLGSLQLFFELLLVYLT